MAENLLLLPSFILTSINADNLSPYKFTLKGDVTVKTQDKRPFVKMYGFKKGTSENNDVLLEEAYEKLTYGAPASSVNSWNNSYSLEKITGAYFSPISGSFTCSEEKFLDFISDYLEKNIALGVGFNVYNSYMDAPNGFCGLIPSGSSVLGGHENIIVGMFKNVPENLKYFKAWGNETKTPKEKWPKALLLFFNSWIIDGIIRGTSPVDVNDDGSLKENRIPSSVNWVPSTYINQAITRISTVSWDLVSNIKLQTTTPTNPRFPATPYKFSLFLNNNT